MQRIREEAADGANLLPEFLIDVAAPSGEVVACVRKKIQARLNKERRPPPPEPAPAD